MVISGNISLPKKGLDKEKLAEQMERSKANDAEWKKGRSWGLVYFAGDEHTDFIKQVYGQFFSENGAGPELFPSLRRFEAELVSMVIGLLGGAEDEVGTMTSGGTESILLAVKAYRDYARGKKPDIREPEIIVPESVHPAFLKAADYFDINVVYVPLDKGYRVNIDKVRDSITDQTICLVASAPSFSHGVVDPVSEMGRIAIDHDVGLHVDACLGSFLLPFMRKLGIDVTGFDFGVPGVTSISADLHKNGYTAKGASVILYKSPELRRYQYYVNTDWPGGMYASPTMQGTRPGGAIAAAWASLMVLGEDGYLELARRSMEVTNALISGIQSLPGLHILGRPEMNVFSFSSREVNIHSLGQRLDAMGWRLNRQNSPHALHMIATPNHEQAVVPFLSDLGKVLEDEKNDPCLHDENAAAVLYGGTVKVTGHNDPHEMALSRLDNLYSL